MEKLVRIKSQGALQQRNWTKQNGENVVISSVELTMTDGIDTFVGEVTDQASDCDQSAATRPEQDVWCEVQTRRERVEITAEW